MAENLAYKTTSDCWKANNDESNFGNYGYLYSWESARKACPSGWHLPSDAEWTTLTKGLEGQWKAGKKLKNIAGWPLFFRKNYGDNQSGFSALPGGYYVNNSSNKYFRYVNQSAYFWTSTAGNDKAFSKARSMTSLDGSISTESYSTTAGLSVRCVKD